MNTVKSTIRDILLSAVKDGKVIEASNPTDTSLDAMIILKNIHQSYDNSLSNILGGIVTECKTLKKSEVAAIEKLRSILSGDETPTQYTHIVLGELINNLRLNYREKLEPNKLSNGFRPTVDIEIDNALVYSTPVNYRYTLLLFTALAESICLWDNGKWRI